MDDSTTLARRALGQLRDIDAAIAALEYPERALDRVLAPRGPFGMRRSGALAEARSVLAAGRRAAVKVRDTPPGDVSLTPDEQIGLEAVILLFGRPALLIENGTFADAPPGWEALETERARIEQTIRSVGRIEIVHRGMVGTGFLVAPGVIMTNRHVADVFSIASEEGGWTFKLGRLPAIDYIDERGTTASATFRIVGVIGIHEDVRIDLALLRVDEQPMRPTPADWSIPPPLPLATAAPAIGETEHLVYLVGYPATDNQGITPAEVLTRIFAGIYEVKRLQPGTITAISPTLPRFAHDCSTLGGNSGSCVVDLQTHEVIGLHFSGSYRDTNYAVALWKLTEDPLLVAAGVELT
jgi:hypothetical protein